MLGWKHRTFKWKTWQYLHHSGWFHHCIWWQSCLHLRHSKNKVFHALVVHNCGQHSTYESGQNLHQLTLPGGPFQHWESEWKTNKHICYVKSLTVYLPLPQKWSVHYSQLQREYGLFIKCKLRPRTSARSTSFRNHTIFYMATIFFFCSWSDVNNCVKVYQLDSLNKKDSC